SWPLRSRAPRDASVPGAGRSWVTMAAGVASSASTGEPDTSAGGPNGTVTATGGRGSTGRSSDSPRTGSTPTSRAGNVVSLPVVSVHLSKGWPAATTTSVGDTTMPAVASAGASGNAVTRPARRRVTSASTNSAGETSGDLSSPRCRSGGGGSTGGDRERGQ